MESEQEQVKKQASKLFNMYFRFDGIESYHDDVYHAKRKCYYKLDSIIKDSESPEFWKSVKKTIENH